MAAKEFAIRSPTGRAWLAFVAGFILAGEVFWELNKDAPATFFNVPFTDGELWGWVAGLGLLSLAGLAWLLALFLAPGSLSLDPDLGTLRRVQRPGLRTRVVVAPSRDWHARVVYFGQAQRRRGLFKRLELSAPGFVEVLLYTDLARGEELVRALDAMQSQLGTFTVQVEQPQAVPEEPSADDAGADAR
jgi:hypothetical protein